MIYFAVDLELIFYLQQLLTLREVIDQAELLEGSSLSVGSSLPHSLLVERLQRTLSDHRRTFVP